MVCASCSVVQEAERVSYKSHDEEVNAAMAAALRQASLLPELAGPSDGCDCAHCTQAKHSQSLQVSTRHNHGKRHDCRQAFGASGSKNSFP